MGQTQQFDTFTNNSLKSKADFEKSLLDLFAPLTPFFSEGNAQVKLFGGASFDEGSSYLEGFSRPLWGIVPLVIAKKKKSKNSSPELDLILARYRQGLEHGSDPSHPEYWEDPSLNYNQRCVEMAAIGFALATIPEKLWEPLSSKGKENLATWLATIQQAPVAQNNWLFFVILVQEGLMKVGRSDLVDQSVYESYLERVASYYYSDGWYRDGGPPEGTIDYYNGFALHFYGLLYAYINESNSSHCFPDTVKKYSTLFKERADLFATTFIYWFTSKGDGLPVGRSLTYRFACASFWGILAHFGHSTITLGQIKGVWMRHLRYWQDKPIFELNNTLSRGYLYSSNHLCERYNSPTSPYWAFKYFAALMLPDEHPFWTITEEPLPPLKKIMPLHGANMIIRHNGDYLDAESALIAPKHMFHKDRYNKLSYSSRNGFNVESNHGWSFGDNILLFSNDKEFWTMRTSVSNQEIIDDHILYYEWKAGKGVRGKTYAIVRNNWTLRHHEIILDEPSYVLETGYSVAGLSSNPTDSFLLPDLRIIKEKREQSFIAIAGDEETYSFIGDIENKRLAVRSNLYPNTNVLYMSTQGVMLTGFYDKGATALTTVICNNIACHQKDDQLLETHLLKEAQLDWLNYKEMILQHNQSHF